MSSGYNKNTFYVVICLLLKELSFCNPNTYVMHLNLRKLSQEPLSSFEYLEVTMFFKNRE